MSMFESLGRYGAAIKNARRQEQVDPRAQQPAVGNPEGYRLAGIAARVTRRPSSSSLLLGTAR